jgi:hypothetical protein
MAGKRAKKVQETLEESEIGRENETLLTMLTVRIEKGHLSRATVLAAIGNAHELTQTPIDPWVVVF